MFPIRDELGRVIGFSGRILEKSDKLAKYVNSPETAIFKKGRVLYALDKARATSSTRRPRSSARGRSTSSAVTWPGSTRPSPRRARR